MSDAAVSPLEILVRRRLFSVVFVEDYLQLQFELDAGEDGLYPHLDFFALPTVAVGDVAYEPTDPSWPNALRGLIGGEVVSCTERVDIGLRLTLDRGDVTLRADNQFEDFVEVALLAAPGHLAVWRPGEPPFV